MLFVVVDYFCFDSCDCLLVAGLLDSVWVLWLLAIVLELHAGMYCSFLWLCCLIV